MRRFIVIALILTAVTAAAQTVSPLNAEYGKKVRGEFSLANDSFAVLPVTLEPMSLNIVDGKPVVTPLAPTTHIKLSEYSARIGAKQVHSFAVDAKCDTYPCAFIVFATMVTGHLDNGVVIATHVGSTFYSCDKQKGCRKSFLRQIAETK
jgi:hypothetical protein